MVKKTVVLMLTLMLTALASAAVAGDNLESQAGRLFLFQKCDVDLYAADPENYSADGCPVSEEGEVPGPWPALLEDGRWGQMKYNLLGPEFQFSFQGKNLDLETEYALIYYPDPYPGNGLICLGTGMANASGNLQIHGKVAIPEGLPRPIDANYTPTFPSGAVGAKIWLVPTADVQCNNDVISNESTGKEEEIPDTTKMIGWNPASYLFEGNLIVYQYTGPVVDDETLVEGEQAAQSVGPMTPVPQGSSANRGQGLAKGKNK